MAPVRHWDSFSATHKRKKIKGLGPSKFKKIFENGKQNEIRITTPLTIDTKIKYTEANHTKEVK